MSSTPRYRSGKNACVRPSAASRSPGATRPLASGTRGTSQIRNCGERTFPNAAKAVTAGRCGDDEALPGCRPAPVEDPDCDDRGQLDERRQRGDGVGQRAVELEGEAADHVRAVQAEPVCRGEDRAAEALDVEPPARLDPEGVPQAAGAGDQERRGHDEDRADERDRSALELVPAASRRDVEQRRRDCGERVALRDHGRPEDAEADRRSARDERGECAREQRRGPEVVPVQHRRAERQRRESGERGGEVEPSPGRRRAARVSAATKATAAAPKPIWSSLKSRT